MKKSATRPPGKRQKSKSAPNTAPQRSERFSTRQAQAMTAILTASEIDGKFGRYRPKLAKKVRPEEIVDFDPFVDRVLPARAGTTEQHSTPIEKAKSMERCAHSTPSSSL